MHLILAPALRDGLEGLIGNLCAFSLWSDKRGDFTFNSCLGTCEIVDFQSTPVVVFLNQWKGSVLLALFSSCLVASSFSRDWNPVQSSQKEEMGSSAHGL